MAERLFDEDPRAYDRIYDLLELIAADPDEAKARLSEYVSTKRVWGSHVRGTDYTVFWNTTDEDLLVVYLIRE